MSEQRMQQITVKFRLRDKHVAEPNRRERFRSSGITATTPRNMLSKRNGHGEINGCRIKPWRRLPQALRSHLALAQPLRGGFLPRRTGARPAIRSGQLR
jgi:hypothetical protein